ncbi:hypothetical protein CC86DRAFT_171974 [Ophiobolus disseminans]|uniref:Uncharacterized protein n=1 Tax=Ophiobolus disseminans TaxID=1469910 RepID=A0A6A7AA65_9PLEO|nr:hypothetical protein CC86DRAFT_171974 [Ophiobolus disseminans]
MVLTAVRYKCGQGSGPPQEQENTLEYPSLQHLTLAPGTRRVSNFRIRVPHLTSLHIVLDNKFHDMNLLLTGGILFPELCSSLRNYTITEDRAVRKCDVPVELIVQLIEPIFERNFYLNTVTLRNIIVNDDRDKKYIFPGFKPGNGRMALLVFDNVRYRVPNENYALSRPKEVGYDWKLFGGLLERADEYHIKKRGKAV